MDGIYLNTGFMITTPITTAGEIRKNPSQITASVSRTAATASAISSEKPTVSGSSAPRTTGPWGFSLKFPLTSLFVGHRNRHDALAVDDAVSVDRKEETKEESEFNEKDENWVLKILHVRSMWSEKKDSRINNEDQEVKDHLENEFNKQDEVVIDEQECDACRVDDDDDSQIEFDRSSFSKLLRRVSLAEARLYSQMSYLGSLAYSINQIKPGNLLRRYRLRFVTSSLEKKAELAAKAEKDKEQNKVQEQENNPPKKDQVLEAEKERVSEAEQTTHAVKNEEEKHGGNLISASTAYHIAASAASYLHSQTISIIPFKSSENNNGEVGMTKAEVASLMATTDSVTAVVAAKEEVKQAVADDLNSMHSSPCDWFVCDDDESTRYFVIQGSESLASWQANLLFEPIQFEGLDVIVHRGIYEAAKGIYEQMLPEVHAHLERYGSRAKLRFTGHSLGGSLSLLVNLMLLIRGQAPRSSLLPVITFGAPSVMCGGDRLLHKLGLPKSHLQGITMHRDIVPRAFSCKYPSRVAELLKAVNGNFRNHPCLNNQNLLYAPMGEFLILQPDAKLSPSHDLLPSGSGLYILTSSVSDLMEAEKQMRAAKSVFLNTPHPLEILSDRGAYGSTGAIQRDHDMESYLVSVQSVIRQELKRVRKARREQRRHAWWPLVSPREHDRSRMESSQGQVKLTRVLQTGSESLKRFTRLVASDHMHLLVILLLPARLLLAEAGNVIRSI